MFASPIAAYQQMEQDADIRGSSPHRLIKLLFDGAIAALNDAKQRVADKDIAGKAASYSKAIAIICDGLLASLNVEEGGELAENLRALYEYMINRLVHANLHNDLVATDEVLGLLQEIGGAWNEIGNPRDSATGY